MNPKIYVTVIIESLKSAIGLLNGELPMQALDITDSLFVAKRICKKHINAPLSWYKNYIHKSTFIEHNSAIYLVFTVRIPESITLSNNLEWYSYEKIRENLDTIGDTTKTILAIASL